MNKKKLIWITVQGSNANWAIMQQKYTPAAMKLLGASEMFAHIRIYNSMNHRQIDMNYEVYTVKTKTTYLKRFKFWRYSFVLMEAY